MLILCESRAEFEKGIGLDKKDFATIEHLLRKGQRQLEMYSAPGIKDIDEEGTCWDGSEPNFVG